MDQSKRKGPVDSSRPGTKIGGVWTACAPKKGLLPGRSSRSRGAGRRPGKPATRRAIFRRVTPSKGISRPLSRRFPASLMSKPASGVWRSAWIASGQALRSHSQQIRWGWRILRTRRRVDQRAGARQASQTSRAFSSSGISSQGIMPVRRIVAAYVLRKASHGGQAPR